MLFSKDRFFQFLVSSFKNSVFWFSGSLFLFVSKDRFFLFLVSSFKSLVVWFSGSLLLLVSKDRFFLILVSSLRSVVFWFSSSLFLLVSKDRFFLFLVVERLGRQDLASPRPPLLPATAPIRLAQNLFSPKNCFEPQNPGLKRQGLAASLDGQCTDKIRKS